MVQEHGLVDVMVAVVKECWMEVGVLEEAD